MLDVGDDIPLYTSRAEVEARAQYHRFLDIPLDQLGHIAAKYELPADRSAWANCGWDGCDEPHRFGFVITHKDGRETTCGQVCGARKGGVEFKEVLANLKRAEDANARRRVVVDLLANKSKVEAEITALIQKIAP